MGRIFLRWAAIVILAAGLIMIFQDCNAGTQGMKILVLTERYGQHESFAAAALEWLDKLSREEKFTFIVMNDTKKFDKTFLSGFNLIIQLDFPPYGWGEIPENAFEDYIENGHGGWIGFHHATLLGEFDGFQMWKWFSGFMGEIRFDNYIAGKADGIVKVEDKNHPVMAGIPSSFSIAEEEWYTFNKSPRPDVHVLASVDESSYKPISEIKMGDHPAIWVNEKVKARNVYFLMGHAGSLFSNNAFTAMFRNAIRWAGGK